MKSESLQLTIDKLVYGGDGLARGPAGATGEGKAVFVPFVLEGERIEARVVEEKPGFLRARAEKLLQASSSRIEPHCPYFRDCGGCHYQHATYEHQLQIKTAILRETLQRIGRIEVPPVQVHASPPWQYRNRTRLKVRGGSGFALGYFPMGSHELLPVEQCPVSSPLINRVIAELWQLGRDSLVNEAVAEIEFFANAPDTRLMVEITLPDRYWKLSRKPSLVDFVTELRRRVPEISGVAVFRSAPRGAVVREVLPDKLQTLFGEDELLYDTGGCEYHVSAGSFFQVNRYLASTLTQLMTAEPAGSSALDLYAGVGFFTLPLSQRFQQVVAIESSPFSFPDLRRNTPANVDARRQATEDFLGKPEERGTNLFDLVVADPPRAGLGEKTAAGLSRLSTSRIAYLSCNPATLARDLKVLLANGFRVEQIHLVDLFPQTFHIESLTRLVR